MYKLFLINKYWLSHSSEHNMANIFLVFLFADLFLEPLGEWDEIKVWARIENLTIFYEINESLFCWRVHYSDNEYNTANIVLFSTNQITAILCVSNKSDLFLINRFILFAPLKSNVVVATSKGL